MLMTCLLRALSSQILKLLKETDVIASLGNLFKSFTTLPVEILFLYVETDFFLLACLCSPLALLQSSVTMIFTYAPVTIKHKAKGLARQTTRSGNQCHQPLKREGSGRLMVLL